MANANDFLNELKGANTRLDGVNNRIDATNPVLMRQMHAWTTSNST